jgi:hypothetical protein
VTTNKIITIEIKHKDMPALSTAQQRLMAQAYAIKIGELQPSDLNPKYRDEIVQLAQSMTKKQLSDFASTKHKNLKHHVSEEQLKDLSVSLEPIPSETMPKFNPHGPGKIIPFLDPDAKQKKKGKKNLQNLKDYRDWSNQS